MTTRSPGAISRRRALRLLRPGRKPHVHVLEDNAIACFLDFNAMGVSLDPIDVDQGPPEFTNAQKRRFPVGDQIDIVDEPAERLLNLCEGADRHQQSAEGQVSGKISGSRDDDRRDDREPSITRRHPGEPRRRADEPPHDVEESIEFDVQTVALLRLAAIDGDAVAILVHPNEREADVGFARVTFGVEVDERLTHAPARERGETGVEKRGPHHIAGNDEARPFNSEADARRKRPEHADEADEQQRRLKQPDAEIGGEFGQMPRILVNALIGIDADRTCVRDQESAPRRRATAEKDPG